MAGRGVGPPDATDDGDVALLGALREGAFAPDCPMRSHTTTAGRDVRPTARSPMDGHLLVRHLGERAVGRMTNHIHDETRPTVDL